MYILDITAASCVGCVRENNEDMLLIDSLLLRNDSTAMKHDLSSSDRFILALADGMGGHQSGEVASSDVLHNLRFFYGDIPAGLKIADFNEVIYEWLKSMNNNLEAKGRVDEHCKGMGTTLVALAFYEDNFYWMNCGDSRLYRLRDGKLTQLTTDHSLNNLMGTDSKDYSNVITNCIGGGCTTSFIDIVECNDDIAVGDTLMLCSDGLTDMIADGEIERLLNNGSDALNLCKAAEEYGGYDNVSVILATVREK
ncbi:MAG: serine/threonine-protein phosphatase [Prevotella sp.]|nr:serine/threonine-protein phosphatase [Prevotella sp.]